MGISIEKYMYIKICMKNILKVNGCTEIIHGKHFFQGKVNVSGGTL